MDLNQLTARLFKAEMVGNVEAIEKYKKEIEDLKRNHVAPDSSRPVADNELNRLNARLFKAQMFNDLEMIEKCRKEIDDYSANKQSTSTPTRLSLLYPQPPAEQTESEPTPDEIDEIAVKLKELNDLKIRLVRAEHLQNKEQIETYKRLIDELVTADKRLLIKEEKMIKASEIDLDKVFDDLVKARMKNDKVVLDVCQEKIDKFEYPFNFKCKDDLAKLIKITGELLTEVLKEKDEEECNGHKEVVKHLDRKAKAIRRKFLDYQQLLDKLPIEKPKAIESRTRLMSERQIKNERTIEETKVIHMVKKVSENNMTLKQMFVSERNAGTDSEDARFVNANSRRGDEYEDEFVGAKRQRKDENPFKCVPQKEEPDEQCPNCLENLKVQLIIESDDKLILRIPEKEPLIDYQLTIQSVEHCPSLVAAGEDVFERVMQLKQKICLLLESIDRKVIFVEQYMKKQTKWNRHFEIICYPIPINEFEDAKICFKKDISEAEHGYAVNKKLIYLTNEKPVNKCIPKNFSYFCVTFGPTNNGFAHVIEDSQRFSRFFGQETIGGLFDLEPERWTKPKFQDFNEQAERFENIRNLWSKFSISSK